MNKILQNILSRRSVREYKLEQIPKESLDQILLAGRYAASGWNNQSWKFIAIQDRKTLITLSDALKQSILNFDSIDDENSHLHYLKKRAESAYDLFYGAPTLVIVTGDKDNYMSRDDCALATGNMMLMATELNIGSCWLNQLVNFTEAPEIRALFDTLKIPENYNIYASLALGYAAKDFKKIIDKKDDVIEII